MASRHDGQEEHFVLRVVDPELAERLRAVLREEPGADLQALLQLTFEESRRKGSLTMGDANYPVHVLDLPTTVESYKTYDDVNLVKTADVGQVLMVGSQLPDAQQAEIAAAAARAQATGEAGAHHAPTLEAVDGITPPMRKARSRHLRPRIDVPPAVLGRVEDAIIDILDGNAPADTEFHDVEEEYVVDGATGRGRWQHVSKETVAKERALQKERDKADAALME